MFRKASKKIASLGFLLLLSLPAAAIAPPGALDPSVPVQAPPGPGVSADQQDLLVNIDMKRSGRWAAMALAASQLLIVLIKLIPATKGRMKDYGTVIVLVLSAGAGVLAMVVGGASVADSLLVFFVTGAPKLLNDLLHEIGVLTHSQLATETTPPDPETQHD